MIDENLDDRVDNLYTEIEELIESDKPVAASKVLRLVRLRDALGVYLNGEK